MQFDDALQYLLRLGHETLTMKLGLENIKRLLCELNSPEKDFLAVQIAGTNGKGSTAAMLDAICRAAGIRTGLYTSPHLVSITERIRINGQEISRECFARAVAKVKEASERVQSQSGALSTFFEQMTAAALIAFRDAEIDLAILETGLGGRLDATTAARAGVAAITQIAFDHQKYLGETIAEIAAEKAAIIHENAEAIIAPQDFAEAQAVIEERARLCNVTPQKSARIAAIEPHRDEKLRGRFRVTFETPNDIYPNVLLSLRGRHQAKNAAVAIALAEAVRARYQFKINRAAIVEGLETAQHAGRLELRETDPPMLLDGAHNAAGARALREYFDEFYAERSVTLIFGAMADKDLREICETLFPIAARIVLTEPPNARAARIEELRKFAPRGFAENKIAMIADPRAALQFAREHAPSDGLICVTGSLYLVGAVRDYLISESAVV
jgi:dihydrofolate synthase/folylpolyglutamate synthase